MKNINNKTKKIKLNDKQIMIVILSVFCVIVLLYAFVSFYYNLTGAIRSEYIANVTESISINADGFVIRDEVKKDGKKNISILKKTKSGIYAPILKDGESVSKNGTVAYIFNNESQVKAYNELKEINNRIELLSKLQNSGNISFLDVAMLNSEISSIVQEYVNFIDDNDFSQLSDTVNNIDYKITSKQIATGTKLNFSNEISKLNKQKNKLEKSIENRQSVSSPSAGYFVGLVDGYENVCDYNDISVNGITTTEVDKILNYTPKSNDTYFGKVISEHIWYYAFNMSFADSSNIKRGNLVNISFPEKGITDLTMKVVSINREDKSDKVSVVLKCSYMNDALLRLRKEKAVITIASYSGYKINKAGITSEDDTLGVYVQSGNLSVFKPIKIVYDGDEYVIGQAVTEDENGKQMPSDKILKAYDRVIVKGKNLYDGKVIG